MKRPVKKEGINLKVVIPTVIAIILLISSTVYVRQGYQYYVLTPFGKSYTIEEPGVKFLVPFSKKSKWDKYFDVATVNSREVSDDIEGVIPGAISVRFVDQVTAALELKVRFELPSGDDFIKIVEEFRTPQNFVKNTLIPTVEEQASNITYLFSAEQYVTGASTEYKETLDDALKNGGFEVLRREVFDTVYNSISNNASPREIKNISKAVRVAKVMDSSGRFKRIEHDITKNKVSVSQVIVSGVTPEESFLTKLNQQRDLSAKKSIELKQIENASITQKRIIAEGERDKAEERVTQELEQVKQLISIETQVKKEESQRQLALIQLETAKINQNKTKVNADAKAYEIAKADGMSELEKYKIDKGVERDIEVTKAKFGPEGVVFPKQYTVLGGSENGNRDDLINALLIQRMVVE